MEATRSEPSRKRQRQDQTGVQAASENPEIRKKVKVKRRGQKKEEGSGKMQEEEMKHEEGAGSGQEFEDSEEDEFEVEDVVQAADEDDDWEDCEEEDSAAAKKKAKIAKAVAQMEEGDDSDEGGSSVDELPEPGMQVDGQKMPQVWDDQKEPLKEGEELEYDGSAYVMLHRSKVEWPCLSIDYLIRERCSMDGFTSPASWFPTQTNGQLDANASNTVTDQKSGLLRHKKDQFPMDVYMVAGSQAEKRSDNKIYVMKWGEMQKTTHEDEELSDSDEEEERNKEPVIRFEAVPHRGGINRIRAMHGTPIVATWTEEAEVSIYNISQAIEELDRPVPTSKQQVQKKKYGGCKLAGFKHRQEGYALDWSASTFGRLASGSNDAQLHLYKSADESCSSFVKEFAVGLQGHKGSIEDLQWSPSQDHVLASCSSDTTIKLWDVRATQMKPAMSWVASDCDVNVISWNSSEQTRFLLASGDDNGEIRIWDLRMLTPFYGAKKADIEPITQIRWHSDAITSIQFEPREESILAVTSADNKMTLWDFSVEVDEADQSMQQNEQLGMEIPPQMMFCHQGQQNMKELRFHPQYSCLMATTAEDSFNVFKPNLEPADTQADQAMSGTEETKQDSSSAAEESKR